MGALRVRAVTDIIVQLCVFLCGVLCFILGKTTVYHGVRYQLDSCI